MTEQKILALLYFVGGNWLAKELRDTQPEHDY